MIKMNWATTEGLPSFSKIPKNLCFSTYQFRFWNNFEILVNRGLFAKKAIPR